MPSVLFVCTANICRSPIASALMRSLVDQRQLGSDWRIESAGTWTQEGYPAASKAQAILKEGGVDISDHRSRSVSGKLLRDFDLILVMEQGHREALQIEFPDIRERVYLLSELAGAVYDIRDPIGGSTEDFMETIREISHLLAQGFDKIVQLAQEASSSPPPQDPS